MNNPAFREINGQIYISQNALAAERATGAADRKWLIKEIENYKETIDYSKSLLEVAKCPDPDCTDGTICTGGSVGLDGETELFVSQCQWCYERDELLV